jgi:hypothetical protein
MSRAPALIRRLSSSRRVWLAHQQRAGAPLAPLVQAAGLLAMRAGAILPCAPLCGVIHPSVSPGGSFGTICNQGWGRATPSAPTACSTSARSKSTCWLIS